MIAISDELTGKNMLITIGYSIWFGKLMDTQGSIAWTSEVPALHNFYMKPLEFSLQPYT